MSRVFGGIEAGGTKFVCVVGAGPHDIRAETRFPTTSPNETLRETLEFFRSAQQRVGPLSAVGIGSFGPVDLDATSPTYGHITSTPKPGWANVDITGCVERDLRMPVGFDTDVNAAALAEGRWGAGRGLGTIVYLTVGTGIGGGGLIDGKPMHGLVHPEMGHIRVPHDRASDPFDGVCPFHGDCLEGLASGPAMLARWGTAAEDLPEHHPGWSLEADYLAHAIASIVCILSPQRVVMGGGVMSPDHLFPLIRTRLVALLNGYLRTPTITHDVDRFVVPPALGRRAGVLGGLALAEAAFSAALPRT